MSEEQPSREQIDEWLYDGAVALCQGDTDIARDLLLRVVEAEEWNEEGWLWLSGAVDDVEDKLTALRNVLTINPENEYANMGLAWIDKKK
jgi:hypothetical protein